jgi:hypothetical protein
MKRIRDCYAVLVAMKGLDAAAALTLSLPDPDPNAEMDQYLVDTPQTPGPAGRTL